MKKHILTIIVLISTATTAFAGGSGAGPGQEMMGRQSEAYSNLRASDSTDRAVIFMGKDQADIKYGTLNDSGSVEVYTNRVEEIAPDVTQALRKSRSSGSWEEVFKSNPSDFKEMKRKLLSE